MESVPVQTLCLAAESFDARRANLAKANPTRLQAAPQDPIAVVERYATLGGVCLNVGCIPSKALLHVAAVMDEVKHMAAVGVDFSEKLAFSPGEIWA